MDLSILLIEIFCNKADIINTHAHQCPAQGKLCRVFGPTDTTAPAPAARGTLDTVEATWTLF